VRQHGGVHAIEQELYGEIVQIKKERLVQVTRCTASQTIKSAYCGIQSRLGMERETGDQGRAAIRMPSPPRERAIPTQGCVDSGAGEGTLPQSECRTALPMSRATRAAADKGWAGVELSYLRNCEGSLILIPEECLVCFSPRDLRPQCSGWPS
jgi:hypothetical protein